MSAPGVALSAAALSPRLRPWLRRGLLVLGLLAGGVLLWTVGPLVAVAGHAPLASPGARWLALGALALLSLAWQAWQLHTQSRHRRALLDGMAAGADAGAEEVALLRERFDAARAALARLRLPGPDGRGGGLLARRRSLDQLPWYMVIGAPGAGKTTVLANSGLDFPLAADGDPVVQGVGGTRHCDWWFTSEAVLLDTAGRYTTQDSHRETDRTAWFGFLALLARHRPRRPINGVLVVLSATDLLKASPARRIAHVSELRERIEELHDRLGIRFPIYLLVSKVDLLSGFNEFFADFDKEQRAQVLGATFPWADRAGPPEGGLPMTAALAELSDRLDAWTLDRLQAEGDRRRRAALHGFPAQWRALAPLVDETVQALVGRLPPALRPCVRGLYFLSATQEGAALDRVLGQLSRTLDLPALPQARGPGKAFFVHRLLREVVFAESGLTGTRSGWQRARRVAVVGGGIAALLGLAVGAGLGWHSHAEQRAAATAWSARLGGLEGAAAAARSAPDTDLTALLPVLDGLAPPVGRDLTLSAEGLDAVAGDVYLRALREGLLPRVARRLEQGLRNESPSQVELVYDALKAYLMLFGGRHYDAQALRAYLVADWSSSLPPSTTAAQRAALHRHLDQLLASGEVGSPAAADASLIAAARERVARVPLAERVYARLMQHDFGAVAPLVADDPAPLLVRADGQAWNELPPALFARDQVELQIDRRVSAVLEQFATEQDWVLGRRDAAIDAAARDRVAADVRQRHAAEHRARWTRWLAGLRLAPATSVDALATQATRLARPDSPLALALQRVAHESGLRSTPVATDGAASGLATLKAYVDGGAAAWGGLQAQLARVGAYLSALQAAPADRGAPVPAAGADAVDTLALAQAAAPEPLNTLLAPLVAAVRVQSFAALREPIERQLAADVGSACQRSLTGRYPFSREAGDEVAREDLARLLASGGMFDRFFQQHLAAHVDASTAQWTWRHGGTAAGDALPAFQRAQRLRAAWFHDGGRQLGAALEFRLLSIDDGIAEFQLDIDGQALRFRPGVLQSLRAHWPGPGPARTVVRMIPSTGRAGTGHEFAGPWGLYRLLDRVRVEPGTGSDRSVLLFDIEGRRARVEVRGASALHALSPRLRMELEQFRCPHRL